MYRRTPDIIAITENKLVERANRNSYPITLYEAIHEPDISVYTKKNMYITHLEDIETERASTIIIQIHKNKQKNDHTHTIINIYRRPPHDPAFIMNIQSTIDQIYTKYPHTSITIQGDINIDLLKLTHLFFNFLIENNLHTTITTPTRYDTRYDAQTLIDVTLTTLTQTAATAGTISPPLSDHLPNYTILHLPISRQERNNEKTLSTSRYDKHKEDIIESIQTAIEAAQTDTNADTTTSQHLENIQTAIQTSIEKYERIPKPRRKPWWCSQSTNEK
jgi:hypothetical protein